MDFYCTAVKVAETQHTSSCTSLNLLEARTYGISGEALTRTVEDKNESECWCVSQSVCVRLI